MASPRVFSGLHDSMPKGATAPGKVLPPAELPISGSTYAAGSLTSVGGGAADAGTVAAVARSPAVRAAAAKAARGLEGIAVPPCRKGRDHRVEQAVGTVPHGGRRP
ncbi:hypothetical protein SSPO_030800 [Streptomyces antimycoticus]|uniref:Uncharacterized protein n=1 Tax=Streptomyces antimycoticus TaxID=68175 RepID=A0A499UI46_9ACTN|nr:hypothetical protein SSPO_030800 [Streptomyces antimycoticus]